MGNLSQTLGLQRNECTQRLEMAAHYGTKRETTCTIVN